MPSTLILNEQDVFQLCYHAADGLLYGRWLAPVLDADLRIHYGELLQEAQLAGNCRYWLLDIRRRNWHMPSFGHWASTEFVPAVRAALGPPIFVAYVMGPRHLSAATRPQDRRTQEQIRAQQLFSESFADEASARAWLHQQRQLAG